MNETPNIFDWLAAKYVQRENLDRVTSAIGHLVLKFVHERGVNGTFHAQDLHEFVGDGVAPASADRILRHLRRDGFFDYEVVNRRASFYRVLSIGRQ
jgi:hypothetical protein